MVGDIDKGTIGSESIFSGPPPPPPPNGGRGRRFDATTERWSPTRWTAELGPKLVDSINRFRKRPQDYRGRVFHEKGVVYSGTFTSTGRARELSDFTGFAADTPAIEAITRFSFLIKQSDEPGPMSFPERDILGMATKLSVPPGDAAKNANGHPEETDLVAMSLEVFPVRHARDFATLLAARLGGARDDALRGAARIFWGLAVAFFALALSRWDRPMGESAPNSNRAFVAALFASALVALLLTVLSDRPGDQQTHDVEQKPSGTRLLFAAQTVILGSAWVLAEYPGVDYQLPQWAEVTVALIALILIVLLGIIWRRAFTKTKYALGAIILGLIVALGFSLLEPSDLMWSGRAEALVLTVLVLLVAVTLWPLKRGNPWPTLAVLPVGASAVALALAHGFRYLHDNLPELAILTLALATLASIVAIPHVDGGTRTFLAIGAGIGAIGLAVALGKIEWWDFEVRSARSLGLVLAVTAIVAVAYTFWGNGREVLGGFLGLAGIVAAALTVVSYNVGVVAIATVLTLWIASYLAKRNPPLAFSLLIGGFVLAWLSLRPINLTWPYPLAVTVTTALFTALLAYFAWKKKYLLVPATALAGLGAALWLMSDGVRTVNLENLGAGTAILFAVAAACLLAAMLLINSTMGVILAFVATGRAPLRSLGKGIKALAKKHVRVNDTDFHGVHTFRLVKTKQEANRLPSPQDHVVTPMRYRWIPVGNVDEACTPMEFLLELSLGKLDWPSVDDPTRVWSEDGERMIAGRLTLDEKLEHDVAGLSFNPTRLAPGIEIGDDDLIAGRRGAMATAYLRRTTSYAAAD